jgi:small subunit ribosomal protein S6
MNKYEITFIVKSDMEEAEIKKTAEAMKKVLTDKSAKILEEKVMGQRELAYEINKMKTGYYFLYVVEADSDTVKEFNRVSGINENLLRHLIVKVED